MEIDKLPAAIEEAVGEAARQMKLLARELDCVVVLVHQLNREVEKSNDPEPKLSHLVDSGDIEKHADVVLFVYAVPGREGDGKTFIKIAKNRNGPTAINEVTYIRREHTFENLTRQTEV